MKKIIISVTNDLVTDNRVHKVCSSLFQNGFNVLLVGRKLSDSNKISREYRTYRFILMFRKGFLFYAEYNIRLFFFLLFRKADLFLANDLDTLPANYLCSKIRGKGLVYDSHEYFTEVPELINRKTVHRIWMWIERHTVPHVKNAYTVCQSLADDYYIKYQTRFSVIRNLPLLNTKVVNYDSINIPKDKKIIIYQGALNIGRGIEYVISSMKYLYNAIFIIVGNGDIENQLKVLTKKEGVEEKVLFLGTIPLEQLSSVTKLAHLGVSLEENLGLNYYYSLPNKIFDYIKACIPVLSSDFPEQKKVVEGFQVGEVSDERNPEKLAQIIHIMLTDEVKRDRWKNNLTKASEELCWEKEEKLLLEFFRNLK